MRNAINRTAEGRIDYNFGGSSHRNDELPGVSVFMKDEAGAVFHTYSTYGREAIATRAHHRRKAQSRNMPPR